MTPMQALLVDDERLARKRLAELLAPHAEIVVAGEADSVAMAAKMVAELQPDVVFLDVEMPPDNGLELLPLLPAAPATPAVVFVTAYETFAVQAFAVSALDYLLKPVRPERLALTLQRLRTTRKTQPPRSGVADDAWTMESRIALGDRQTRRTVEVREIVAIQALGAYSRVNLRAQPAMIVLRSISEWEQRLPENEFSRIDRSLIVRPMLLRVMEKKSRDETLVTLEGLPEKLTIGRMAALRLRKRLDGDG